MKMLLLPAVLFSLVFVINGVPDGKYTKIEAVPWHVSVSYTSTDDDGNIKGMRFLGAGSILSNNHILTPAHAFDTYNDTYYIVVGHGTNENFYSAGMEHFAHIKKFVKHPKYNPDTREYDVAIVTLAEPLEFDASNQPITLTTKEPEQGDTVTLSGWGNDEYDIGFEQPWLTTATITVGVNTEQEYCMLDMGGPVVVNGHQSAIMSQQMEICGPWGNYQSVGVAKAFIDKNTNSKAVWA